MFAGRAAQAYCLSPAAGLALVETSEVQSIQAAERKTPLMQQMQAPVDVPGRWHVYVSTCANTGILMRGTSTTSISYLIGGCELFKVRQY